MFQIRVTTAILCFLAALLPERAVRAADTIETFDPGPSNAELHGGYRGGATGEFLMGFGMMERFSSFISASFETGPGGSAGFHAGIFGTPVDRDHVDIDLVLDLESGSPGIDGLSVEPSLELNLDLEPDLGLWGVYLRLGLPVEVAAVSIPVVLGTYVTAARVHQVLLEGDVTFHPLACGKERHVEVGGIALGYNVMIHESVELITEALLDVPQDGESWGVGVKAGLILTLPVSAATYRGRSRSGP